jgi:hypothetical protein
VAAHEAARGQIVYIAEHGNRSNVHGDH